MVVSQERKRGDVEAANRWVGGGRGWEKKEGRVGWMGRGEGILRGGQVRARRARRRMKTLEEL